MRFLHAVGTDTDRRVLAPLYLRDLVYRVMQREQYARLLDLAAAESASNPVSAVLEYVRGHMSEPLTVADMADLVCLSPSAFAHLFRDVTGRSPYQFVKEMRLDRARDCSSTAASPWPGSPRKSATPASRTSSANSAVASA